MRVVRSAWAAMGVWWRDSSALGRGQVFAVSGLASLVFGTFVYGAVNRRPPALPAPLAGSPGAVLAQAGRRLTTARLGRPAVMGAPKQAGPSAPGAAIPGHPGVAGLGPGTLRARGSHHGSRGRPTRPGRGTPLSFAASAPLSVAIAYPAASEEAQLSAALGAGGAPGDWQAEAQAVTGWVNDHGGVAGRPLTLNLASFDPASVTAGADPFASACAALAGAPLRPVAVIAPLEDADSQSGCLRAHGLVLVGDAPAPGDDTTFSTAASSLFAPDSMSLDGLISAELASLQRTGFLTRGTRVGIVRADAAPFARADARTLRPSLAALGVTVADDRAITPPRTAAEVPGTQLTASAIASRFELERLNTLIVLDDDGLLTPLFMQAAQRLGYAPRYALNSTMAPGALPARVAGAQLAGAQGVGISPLLDVAATREPPPTGNRSLCDAIYSAAHLDIGARTVSGAYSAITLCDELLDVRAALTGAQDPTPAALASGLERLGTLAPAAALAARLSPEHHDGASQVRPLAYDAGCGCMTYTGSAQVAG